jgi:alkylation response protein AidB-like acyl-CoA dehydrogenase
MLRDSVSRFVDDTWSLEKRRQLIDSPDVFSRERWRQFADMGWLGINLPESVGGLECGAVEATLLLEQFGRGLLLEPYVPTVVIGARLIDRCGTQVLREELLPALIAGDLQLALAHEEPTSRGLPALPETVARRDGDGWRLSGCKIMALNAPAADRIIVSARLDNSAQIGLFLLPAAAPGLGVEPYALVCGRSAGDLRMYSVRCEPSQLLASGETAAAALAEALDWAGMALMAEALGSIEDCLAITADYIKQRVQFGQPLAKFQSLQHLMAEMFVDAQESRSILYQALAHIDDKPAVRTRAVSAARVVIGEAGRRVAAKGVQMHGGYGTTDEYAISHHHRQLFVLERLFGDVDFHLRRLAAGW